MKVISFIAQKGGTGKTTLAISLACAAQSEGIDTVVIDLDPQSSACRWGDRHQAALEDAGGPSVADAQPSRLPNALAAARSHGVGLAVIDTPARSEQAALEAAKVSDLVVIPCRPQLLDLETVPNSLELLRLAGRNGSVVAVLNAVPPRGLRHEQAAAGLAKLGIMVAPQALGQRAAFGDATALGLSVLEYEPDGKAAEELRMLWIHIKQIAGLTKNPKTGKSTKRKSRMEAA